MTKNDLLENGWVEKKSIFNFIQYEKEINGFFYTLTDMDSVDPEKIYTNLFNWVLQIDDSKHQSIASCEVDNFEHINLLSKIYNESL